MALTEAWLGHCEQSNGDIKQAFVLSSRDPIFGGLWHWMLGVSEGCLGKLDAAIVEFKRAIDAGYRTYLPAYLAGAEAAKGNDAEAKSALAEARRLSPQLTIKWLNASEPNTPEILDGLRKAGLPEE